MKDDKFSLPINWNDYEDIAMGLYEKFGDDFSESKIYRVRFTELLEWVLPAHVSKPAKATWSRSSLPGFTSGVIINNSVGSVQLAVSTYVCHAIYNSPLITAHCKL
jgi:hypothetical protein